MPDESNSKCRPALAGFMFKQAKLEEQFDTLARLIGEEAKV